MVAAREMRTQGNQYACTFWCYWQETHVEYYLEEVILKELAILYMPYMLDCHSNIKNLVLGRQHIAEGISLPVQHVRPLTRSVTTR